MTLRSIFAFCIVMLFASLARAQPDADLRVAVRAVGTTLRVLQITAHPGDEDGSLLLYQVRAQGAQVTLLTLTRGERGDNPHAILAPTEQGLQRTMEQLASDARYGVDQRFTRVVDFGFARTADEVFDRWSGHNAVLGDMVRVIRETRPDIITTPFDIASPDGDGQHEATAILAREAFHASADAKKFPEQLRDGVEPWQAKRLFAMVHSGGYSVAFNADSVGAGERESWLQQAERALAEQHSQEGMWHGPREPVRRYRLVDSAAGFSMDKGTADFTDGLDLGLPAMADELGAIVQKDEKLQVRSRLHAMSDAAMAAQQSVAQEGGVERASCMSQLAEYLRNLRGVEDRTLGTRSPAVLRTELAAKRRQAEHAMALAAGLRVQARLANDGKDGAGQDGIASVLVPGENFAVRVQVQAIAGVNFRVAGMELRPEGGRWTPRREWIAGDAHAVFRGRVPNDAPFTRPQFLLEGEEDGAYRIFDEHSATHALPAASLQAVAEVEIDGEVVRAGAPVEAGEDAALRTVMIAPPVSVIVEPITHWNRRTNLSYGEIEVRVRSNLPVLQNALLSVHPPSGWRAEPEHEVLDIGKRGEEHSYRFFLIQDSGGPGAFPVRAVVRWANTVFDQGYTIVRGPGDQVAFDYRSSNGVLVSADVDVPENLEVGYVGVQGDPIPNALRDINVKVSLLDRDELVIGRLAKYWAIVLGPHAVDTRDELAEARARLLRYAEDGGALVIMAQSDAERFSTNAPVPYALELGTARVSNEASAIQMSDEHDDVFQEPNEIGSEGFRGWTEERGRDFAQRWDGHFESLLRMGDPGQPAQEGGLVRVRYGRGSVVYTGLSFDRQLPAGVPGALRLLVNLLSAGEELHR